MKNLNIFRYNKIVLHLFGNNKMCGSQKQLNIKLLLNSEFYFTTFTNNLLFSVIVFCVKMLSILQNNKNVVNAFGGHKIFR